MDNIREAGPVHLGVKRKKKKIFSPLQLYGDGQGLAGREKTTKLLLLPLRQRQRN